MDTFDLKLSPMAILPRKEGLAGLSISFVLTFVMRTYFHRHPQREYMRYCPLYGGTYLQIRSVLDTIPLNHEIEK